jgi:hypothetical protein
MKKIALGVLLVVIAGCSSRDGFIDSRRLDCDSGQEISIRAGVVGISPGLELGTDTLAFAVEISNNAHREITVKSIHAAQVSDQTSRYRVLPVRRQFDQTIAEGDDHLFELPMDGRSVGEPLNRASMQSEILLLVTVALADGDSYRCRFSVPAPL